MNDVLRVEGLAKHFGNLVAVDGISFHIQEGETYGLLGPNGAGKTTAISMIAGLMDPDAGEVIVAGRPVTTSSVDAKEAIGLVPQELAIYPDLSGRENLKFFGRLYGLTGKRLAQRVDEVLAVVGLAGRASDHSKEYSGGMKRRLNIAIGLLHRPRLLILDEPTVGVDPQSRNAILQNVEDLSGEGIAVLYTTHYMEEAERLCDRVGIIDEGRIRGEGSRRELVSSVGERDRIVIDGRGDLESGAQAARRCEGVLEASVADHRIDVLAADASSVLSKLLAEITSGGVLVSGVQVHEPNLEVVFLHLTGKALRD